MSKKKNSKHKLEKLVLATSILELLRVIMEIIKKLLE